MPFSQFAVSTLGKYYTYEFISKCGDSKNLTMALQPRCEEKNVKHA